jgi:hypothetical protein
MAPFARTTLVIVLLALLSAPALAQRSRDSGRTVGYDIDVSIQ